MCHRTFYPFAEQFVDIDNMLHIIIALSTGTTIVTSRVMTNGIMRSPRREA